MNKSVQSRAVVLGEYIADTGATVRAAAKVFKISKSTVHKDVSKRLKDIDAALYKRVDKILQQNKSERHIRGGEATKNKYLSLSRTKKTNDNRQI